MYLGWHWKEPFRGWKNKRKRWNLTSCVFSIYFNWFTNHFIKVSYVFLYILVHHLSSKTFESHLLAHLLKLDWSLVWDIPSPCARDSLKSGDSAGVFHQLIVLACRKALAFIDVWLASLPIISLWWSGYTSLTNSIKKSFKIWQNPSASSVPVKMQILVARLQLMPAHNRISLDA